MHCPKCGSGGISKEKTRRGWSGDYVCGECGYNDAKYAFEEEDKTQVKATKWKLKEQPKTI